MSGKDAGDLYATARDRLFARNIRGFLGDTAINEGMRETLTREAEHCRVGGFNGEGLSVIFLFSTTRYVSFRTL